MQRKLAAILAADVVGYSRMMANDEAGTLSALKAFRATVLEPVVQQEGGRIVKLMGDGVLVEFASVVNAVNSALAIQKHPERSEAVVLRIGINLGDVIVEDDDIYGDGVNVAARLEAMATPGGICLSSIVHESLGGRTTEVFSPGGEQTFKNIDRPIAVYHWPPQESKPQLIVQERPSIAVLPFDNMSSDADQDFFADGIAEDVITELSKFRSLLVIARNSSFAFKGQGLDIKTIAAKLGVRYVVEGSVRRAGQRVRITAQLIDALDDRHLWAERYDRDLEDIFAIQDEVTNNIVNAIEPEMLSSERQRALRKPPENLDAWESYQRGLWHAYRYRADERDQALTFLRRAIELDPTFAPAYGGLSFALYVYVLLNASDDREGDIRSSIEAARRGIAYDEKDPLCYASLGRTLTLDGQALAGVEAADKAIEINPNLGMAHFARAHSLWHCGRPEEAIVSHDQAIRLNAHDPMIWAYYASKAIALVMVGKFEEGILNSRKAQQQKNTAIFAHLGELSGLGNLGRQSDYADALQRAAHLMPDLSVSFLRDVLPIMDGPTKDRFLNGLLAAGLPEKLPT